MSTEAQLTRTEPTGTPPQPKFGATPGVTHEWRDWLDRRVLDRDGVPIGVIADLYSEAATGRRGWLALWADAPDAPVVLVPARGASLLGEDVVIAHHRHAVATAPVTAADGDLDRCLSRHYTRSALPSADAPMNRKELRS